MAKRFYSEDIISLEGYTYVIEIYDSSHSGSAHEFVCEANGFELIYENSGGELFKPINASRVEFSIYANNAQIEGFYEDVITAAENRFLVKITRNGSLFWYGKIVADIGIKEDIDRDMQPIYKVVALDGLGLLSQKEYNDNGTAYTGKARLIEHIKNCLAKIGTLGEFTGATDPAIITVVEWHEDNMAHGAGDDPLYLTRADHVSFFSVDSKGKKTYKSCTEVLEAILQIFGAKIYQANGAWRIEQVTERRNASIAEISYDETGAYLNNASVNYTINLDQATNAKIVGGEYTYFPPVREVRIEYRQENWRNYNEGAIFISEVTPAHVSIYEAEIGANSTFQITANISQTITYTGTPYVAVFCVFFCEFKVGTRYLNRDIASIFGTNITYGPVTWETTPSRYYFAFPFQATGSGTQVKNSGIIINTPTLLEGGFPTIKLSFQEFRKMTTGQPTTAGLSQSFNIANIYTRLLHFGNYNEEFLGYQFIVYANNGLNNSELIEIESLLGDELIPAANTLEIWNGSAWVKSNAWRGDVSGSYTYLLNLLAEEMISVLREPVEKWLGTIKGQFDARHRLGWSSSHYIFLGGALTARTDEWRGTFVKITRDKTDITIATPIALGADPNDGKTPFNPVQTPSVFVDPNETTTEMNVAGVIGNIMSHVTALDPINSGVVSSIKLTNPVNAGAFQAGQTLTIVNPVNGAQQNLTVTTTNLQGATSIAVSGYAAESFPEGSYIMVSPQNWTIGTGGATVEDSTWWEIYGQHWSLDDTNANQWPIEGYDTVLETNINAGNGSTAGIRLDGDGITAYASTSTYPRFAVSTDGKLRAYQSAHPATTSAGLIYVRDGIFYNDGAFESSKMLPQFGHTKQVGVIGYDVDWATSNNWPIMGWGPAYEDYVIYKIYYIMQTAGSNNNQVFIQEFDGTTVNTIATITTAGQTYGTIDLSPVFAITSNKYIRFIVNAITGTAPKGLFVEFYFRTA